MRERRGKGLGKRRGGDGETKIEWVGRNGEDCREEKGVGEKWVVGVWGEDEAGDGSLRRKEGQSFRYIDQAGWSPGYNPEVRRLHEKPLRITTLGYAVALEISFLLLTHFTARQHWIKHKDTVLSTEQVLLEFYWLPSCVLKVRVFCPLIDFRSKPLISLRHFSQSPERKCHAKTPVAHVLLLFAVCVVNRLNRSWPC